MADPATAAAEHGTGGLPQFDLAQWPGQMVWAIIVFTALYFLLSRVIVPRLGGAIDAREDRIAGDIKSARALRDEAEAQSAAAEAELAQARARAHKVAADAQAAAKAQAAARQAQEDAKLAVVMGEADARIAAARGEAMNHVRVIAEETAQAMVAKLTGLPAAPAELERARAGHA
jgi:F-type H+-transporting ATPase subunit b